MILVIGTDLGLIVTDFLNDRQRCILLGKGGGGEIRGMHPREIVWILTPQSHLSWGSESFREDIG